MTTRCAFTRPDGAACGNRPLVGEAFCRWHVPGAERRRRHPLATAEIATPAELEAMEKGVAFTLLLSAMLVAQKTEPGDDALLAEIITAAQGGDPGKFVQALSLLPVADSRALLVEAANSVPDVEQAFEHLPDLWESLGKLRDLFRKVAQSPGGETSATLTREVPSTLPLVTSEEPRSLIEAIAHGRTGKGWGQAEDGSARVYTPGHGHQVKLTVYTAPDEWGALERSLRLDAILARWDLDTAFLALTVIGSMADATIRHAPGVASGAVAPVADLDVDEILTALGRDRRAGREKWNEWRRSVRRQLLELSGAAVVGARRGVYRTPGSREVESTHQSEALFIVIDQETTWLAGQPTLDGAGIPVRVRIHGGGLFRRIARNPSMLQHLGGLRTLSAIPAGKAAGRWARAMGLSFAQFVREQSTRPNPKRFLTRRQLLLRFPPNPLPAEVYESGGRDRVLDYWKRAKVELVTQKWWGKFPEPPPPGLRNWLDLWLDQEVTPPVGEAISAPLPGLAAAAAAARRSLVRKSPARSKKKG